MKQVKKEFECKPKCKFPKIEAISFACNKCIKHYIVHLTEKEKERILAILNER